MTLRELLSFVIDDGVESLRRDHPGVEGRMRFEGGRAGFEACRDKEPAAIRDMLAAASLRRMRAHQERADDYWWHRYHETQIAYVAEILSVGLVLQNLSPIVTVGDMARLRYAEIVGVERKRNGSRR